WEKGQGDNMGRLVYLGFVCLALLAILQIVGADYFTDSRFDSLEDSSGIASYMNVSLNPGNVSFTGSGYNSSINISSASAHVVSITESTSIKGLATNG